MMRAPRDLTDEELEARLRGNGADAAAEPPPRLVPIPWAQLHKLPRREALISGLLDIGAMSVVYGGAGCGKTFFALDLSAPVALERDWRGRAVAGGAVVYIAAEGGLGIEERLTAFRVHHDIAVDGVPLYVVAEPIDLCRSDADTDLLLSRLAELPDDSPLRLIVVDTVSRALAGGNENAADDMGALVRHCDRIRAETGAHVMLIHHTGKDDGRGARGHSLLRAAADTEIEVVKIDGVSTATVTKQRDRATGDTFSFTLEPVEIGQDSEGMTITSCVVMPTERSAPQLPQRKLPKSAEIALKALRMAVDEAGEPAPGSNHIPAGARVCAMTTWRAYAFKLAISTSTSDDGRAKRAAFQRAAEILIDAGKVGHWEPYTWLIE